MTNVSNLLGKVLNYEGKSQNPVN